MRTLTLLPTAGPTAIHAHLGTYTKYIQTLAILEIVHIALGLLRSSLPTTIIQVSSRLLLVWGVCDRFDAPQHSAAYASMLVAWSITEVCRYLYYVLNLSGGDVGVLAWLRYNTFFVLYPMGAGSEAWCVFRALPEAWVFNQGYYWVLVVILVTYAPGECWTFWEVERGDTDKCGVRALQSVYAYDSAEEKEYEGEEEGVEGVRGGGADGGGRYWRNAMYWERFADRQNDAFQVPATFGPILHGYKVNCIEASIPDV